MIWGYFFNGNFSARAVIDGAASEIWIVVMCFGVAAAVSPVPLTRLPMALVQLLAEIWHPPRSTWASTGGWLRCL